MWNGCGDSGPSGEELDGGEGTCGNGIVEEGEECDDGNTEDGDGCSSDCRVEPGYLCEGAPSHCFRVTALEITPPSWSGYGLFEGTTFSCSAHLSDGTLDEDCTRMDAPVLWNSLGAGYFLVDSSTREATDFMEGGAVLWESGHGEFSGGIRVEYAGVEALIPVEATLPDGILPPGYWSHAVLPELTDAQVLQICAAADENYLAKQEDAADVLSDSLEDYIRGWLAGENPPEIPPGYLPPSIDNEKTPMWRLYRPDEITAEEQWYVYPAGEEPQATGFTELHKNNAATHVTYLKMHFLAPFGSRLVVHGEFPHARFMTYQLSPPFDPEFPYVSNVGQLEVPIVDVDIDPDPGSVNPFRPGEDRSAADRSYTVDFDLARGNMVALNPVLQNGNYRAPGNTRVGGPFSATGPMGDGAIIPPVLWLRYYVPDDGTGPFAGAPIPKAVLRLDTGEEFWLQPDLEFITRRQVKVIPGVAENLLYTVPDIIGPGFGWQKMFDIYLVWAEGRARQKVWQECPGHSDPPGCEQAYKEAVLNIYECKTNKGPDKPPPGNIGHSATDCPYNYYLVRPTQFTPGRVYAVKGRKPVTPRTRSGETLMTPAEARYWSICHTGTGPDGLYNGVVYGCVLDEDVTVDPENDYIILFSRGEDNRPENARSECGVTWKDIGPEWRQTFVVRWTAVYPDHYLENPHVPNDDNLPWRTAAWSQPLFDETLVSENEPGVMGPYHPVLHNLSVEEFESLGCPVDKTLLPEWE